ncbi:hypothetical protein QQS21_006741 [Conoideocrella luteorostrata]|uniref:Uncharacterized protein n=1 Tax=Conoideocrella luteorostrata TaxID=1105319 RepID=A0AAJ0CQ11_9HYPO|nr:hypothetical protein QQS21_006741 [Conoideocrella luteorostrata]
MHRGIYAVKVAFQLRSMLFKAESGQIENYLCHILYWHPVDHVQDAAEIPRKKAEVNRTGDETGKPFMRIPFPLLASRAGDLPVANGHAGYARRLRGRIQDTATGDLGLTVAHLRKGEVCEAMFRNTGH